MPLFGVQKRSKLTVASAVLAFLAIAVFLAACAGQPAYPPQPGNEQPPGLFPTDPITEQGVATQSLYTVTFWIAVAVFAVVEGLLLWITIRYRRRPTDVDLPKQTHGSNPLELLWTIIPTITVTALFIGVLITLTEQHTVSATDQPDLVVDVTGFQWQWKFDYPDQGLSFTGTGRTGPTMALPTNETVRIRLHSSDVIHAFYVPQFLYKLDVVPGRVNEMDVNITNPGVYGGQCAEFCGLAHADMHFTVHAMSRGEFDAWVVEQRNAIPTPGPSAPPDAAAVALTATGIQPPGFDQTTITAPADQPWVINLTNADPAVPHDVSIRQANPDGSDWLGEPDAPGGGSATYQPPPLPAGTYEFFCSLHPTTMKGTLNVGQ